MGLPALKDLHDFLAVPTLPRLDTFRHDGIVDGASRREMERTADAFSEDVSHRQERLGDLKIGVANAFHDYFLESFKTDFNVDEPIKGLRLLIADTRGGIAGRKRAFDDFRKSFDHAIDSVAKISFSDSKYLRHLFTRYDALMDQESNLRLELLKFLSDLLMKAEKTADALMRIANRVEPQAGNLNMAIKWCCSYPVPSFGGRTIERVIWDGHLNLAENYLDDVEQGAFA
jgi:hypothetical protein